MLVNAIPPLKATLMQTKVSVLVFLCGVVRCIERICCGMPRHNDDGQSFCCILGISSVVATGLSKLALTFLVLELVTASGLSFKHDGLGYLAIQHHYFHSTYDLPTNILMAKRTLVVSFVVFHL